jgi:predicted CxxxxCH...CXXCH cytochrome family protein
VAPGEVGIAATYNAKTGAAAWTAATQTCSNVSCHGGQTTPSFQNTASLAANCAACHVRGTAAATPQYNVYYSGRHNLHLESGFRGGPAACSDCHQMANGSAGANNHFAKLGTSAMEGPAADTITFNPAVVSGARTYNRSNRTCAITCHGEAHDTGMNW